ncbi:MAG: DUF393 domain-containing protein [Leptolyngbya sp. PLA1]|nr:DUF393 domain-containing protein [Leptolyngbya sp. PLA1]
MRDRCYYDGRCGLCRRSVTWLRRLDWLDRLEFRDLHEAADDLPVTLDLADTGMPMRTATGRVLLGFRAIRRALVQTPLGVLPALLLYIPGVSYLASVGYQWIARHRPRDRCRLPGADT